MAFGSSLTAAKRRMRIRSTSIGLLASLAVTLIPVAPVVADHEHAPVPFSWDCWVGCGSNPALNCIRDRDLLEASRSETDHAAREVLDHIHRLLHSGHNEAADWVLADDAEFLHENDVFVFRALRRRAAAIGADGPGAAVPRRARLRHLHQLVESADLQTADSVPCNAPGLSARRAT